MRNSLFPIIMTLIVAAAAVALIPRTSTAGREGPLINSGMFRLPVGDKGRVVALAEISLENSVAFEHEHDRRVGLEPDSWDCVALVGDDREPATKALILALAENLTARGTLVVVNARAAREQGQPLSIAVDRVIRIATINAQPLPALPGEPYGFAVRVRHAAARLPDDHPAAGLQWAGGAHETTFTIVQRSRATGSGDREWGPWWAAIGRSLARETIAAIAPENVPGAPLPIDWTHRRAQWPDRLADPPSDPVVRWHAAFEHDLVRGWVGRIDGTTTLAKDGETTSAFAPLEKRLKSGEWEATSIEGAPLRTWQKRRDDVVHQFSARSTGNGWDLTCWQEWPEPAGVHDEWIDAAQAGDVEARDRLRRALGSAALPPDQQDAARALLAQEPDAAEAARLTPGAPAQPTVLVRGQAQTLPLRPTRVACGGTTVVWLVTPARADQRDSHAVTVGQAAAGIAVISAPTPTLTASAGVDAEVIDRLRAAMVEAKPAQTLVTAAGAAVTIPLADGRLVATCTAGRMTLTWH